MAKISLISSTVAAAQTSGSVACAEGGERTADSSKQDRRCEQPDTIKTTRQQLEMECYSATLFTNVNGWSGKVHGRSSSFGQATELSDEDTFMRSAKWRSTRGLRGRGGGGGFRLSDRNCARV